VQDRTIVFYSPFSMKNGKGDQTPGNGGGDVAVVFLRHVALVLELDGRTSANWTPIERLAVPSAGLGRFCP